MKTIYRCEICGNDYDTAEKAMFCENQETIGQKDIKIGSIVVLPNFYYGWFEGDEKWIQSSKKSETGETYSGFYYWFYFVVTNITKDKHRYKYHLCSLATKQTYGWNVSETHYRMALATDIPKEKRDQIMKNFEETLKGKTYDNLL